MSDSEAGGGLRAVYDGVRAILADSAGARAVWGPNLIGDPSFAAVALRAAGASWYWAAVGFAGRSFWDVHVGILPLLAGYSVGLHWTPAVDHEVRPWAQIAVPGGTLQFAAGAGEYQLLSSDSAGVAIHSTQSAVDVALSISWRVLSLEITDQPGTADVCP
ncbi:hypothetical protein [Micromonospora sp. WMMD1274]|uniref:hypothetical protein n=1 Tax=unclassified Micromonospora TaxID=2617518 RepID=UPI0013B971B7|nr:hypothetical protein [Micromonospora aurantiaca]